MLPFSMRKEESSKSNFFIVYFYLLYHVLSPIKIVICVVFRSVMVMLGTITKKDSLSKIIYNLILKV